MLALRRGPGVRPPASLTPLFRLSTHQPTCSPYRRGSSSSASILGQELITTPSPEVQATLRKAQAFCFDVDSTFCEDESIDELAAFLGTGDQVAALTASAMGGAVDFYTALSGRLQVIQPTQGDIDRFLAKHPHRISKGIPELVRLLQSRGVGVFLVSGGFRQIIHPLAETLGIPISNVHANTVLFDADGKYAGFDEKEFTCRSGGKPAAVRHIKAQNGFSHVIMVGDGATDMEARSDGAADLFVWYGGALVRPNIAAKADWFITDIMQLVDVLQ